MKQLLVKIKRLYQEHSRIVKVIFLFSVLLFVINQLTSILHGMTWRELSQVLWSQSLPTLLIMTGVGILAVLPMLCYDAVTVSILVEHGKPKLAKKEIFLAAWTTNTINNLAGFGGIIGATLRGRFYGSQAESRKVVGTVSKVAIFMISGLSLLAAITFLDIMLIHPANPFRGYWIWLLAGSLYAPALVIFTRLRRHKMFSDFPLKRVLQLMLASLGQWLGALTCFLVIGKLLNSTVPLTVVYPLFVVATLIGMLTMVPGGMGTFDVILLLGLAQVGLPKEIALAWLLFYRLFYYILPFITGVAAYLHQTGAKVNQFFDGLPESLLQRLAHLVLVMMVYFAGLGMILLATIPNLSNINWLFQKILPFTFNLFDQTLNMLMGFILLGLARGVRSQVKKAYLPTLGVLVFCIVNTISRTVSWKLLLFYAFLVICLYFARKEFYRLQLTFTLGEIVFDSLLYGALFILYSIVGFYSTTHAAYKLSQSNFLLFPSETVWLQGLIGVILALGTIFLLYRYLGSKEQPGEPFERHRIEWMLRNHRGTHLSHLAYLKNKRHYYYQENSWDQVMFTFEIQGSKLFVLGDPVGENELLLVASQQFYQYADKRGYQLVFYSISAEYALLLHDLGFEFMKLGEEGRLDLRQSYYVKGQRTEQQLITQRVVNQGYDFQVYSTPISEERLVELEKVSDEWQESHKERYFSMGQFDYDYLNQAPVGIVYSPTREIIAFVSLKPISEEIVSYDLLRYKNNAPAEIRTYLITSLIDYAQREGMSRFKIGFAPFSSVGESAFSFTKERLLHTLYKYSYPVYDFQEIRNFKEDFATKWEPYYLSYQRRNNIVLIMLQIYWLVGRETPKQLSPLERLRKEELSNNS